MFAAFFRYLNKLSTPVTAPVVTPSPAPSAVAKPELAGRRLRYLIGTDTVSLGADDVVTEVGYDATAPVKRGASIKYCNLFDEKFDSGGLYGPYLHGSDTARQYGEGQIDPVGAGWHKNLVEQFTRAKDQGFSVVELDNPDAYGIDDVVGAVNLAAAHGLSVIAKNPLLLKVDALAYVKNPAIVGVIVERDAGTPAEMDALRQNAGKPALPVWFVAFKDATQDGRDWITRVAAFIQASKYAGMFASYSSDGEYTSSIDIGAAVPPVVPVAPAQPPPTSAAPALISQAAIDLIVATEVGDVDNPSREASRKQYESKYRRPEWPGGSSGVTIGIGYDVGAGVSSKTQLWNDWRAHIPDAMISALEPSIGVTGSRAHALLASVRNKVDVPWDAAMAVFADVDVPRWTKLCAAALTNFDLLSPDCKGALVSLAYNRGASFSTAGDRYSEMRAIRAHMIAKDFAAIPGEFRAMKRIWAGSGVPGLLKRRDLEADLFQRGLKAAVPTSPPAPQPVPPASLPTMLILRGIAGNFAGKDWPHGALDEPSALAYATQRGYAGRVLDVSGETGPTSAQTLLALREFRADQSVRAFYGFSGGGYNLRHILYALSAAEEARVRLAVVLGAPNNPARFYAGPWELVYRADPAGGHMDGPRALLTEGATYKVAPKPAVVVQPPAAPPVGHLTPELHDLGHRIKRTMLASSYPWFDDQNVVAVEGMNPDGKPNNNRSNAFDDIKMVLDGDGKIIGGPWCATTMSGAYWTKHRMNPAGAFDIDLGPQSIWTPGDYHGLTVWRQAEDSHIRGFRDDAEDFTRHGTPQLYGNIGVHHHGGGDQAHDDIGRRAAGCQVIDLVADQAQFMRITLACPRYLADKKGYRLTATVVRADGILP